MPEKRVMFMPLEKALENRKSVTPAEEAPPVEKEKSVVGETTSTPVFEPKATAPVTKSGKKHIILVAEDEKALSRALELKLTNQGFDVITAFDGEEALQKAKDNKVDLLILDIVMPKLDGFGVLEKLKEENIKTNVVVISNLSQDEDKDKAIKLGASEYFIKSDIPISDIVNYINKTLNA